MLRKITDEELKETLRKHRLWLERSPEGQRANFYKTDLSYADLSNVDLTSATLSNADLYKANLSNTNLSHADLSYAILYKSNLANANIYKANLSNTSISGTGIYSFQLDRDFGVYYKKDEQIIVKIGCEEHDLTYWLKHYEEIGKFNRYSDKEIRMYGIQLRAIKEILKVSA